MRHLSLLPLLLVSCQGYDNVQACEDWARESGCREFFLRHYSESLDCTWVEDYECDLAEYFGCFLEHYPCPPESEMTSWPDYCGDLLSCEPS